MNPPQRRRTDPSNALQSEVNTAANSALTF